MLISAEGKYDEEIEQQVETAAKVVEVIRKEVLERRELTKKTQLRVFNAMVVVSTLT